MYGGMDEFEKERRYGVSDYLDWVDEGGFDVVWVLVVCG